ncbi:LysR family transcriptional regulator [uncultured Paracoccus sp.]|nr:LysR family transcriptional regulator [uncultured Paracoccus sp.]
MNQLLAMRTFVRLVETASFTRTADQLCIARSTASKLIADLERYLGVRLVERTTRKIGVTAEGLAYHDRIAGILADLDDADRAIRGSGLKPAGRLRIEAPRSFADRLLIPMLPGFAADYPDIQIALGVNDRTANMIGEGVHCAIRGGPRRTRR